MSQNIHTVNFLDKFGQTIGSFLTFLINPWVCGIVVKPLQKRVDLLEKRVYEDLSDTEQRLLLMIETLQNQVEFLHKEIKNNLTESEIRQKVMAGGNRERNFPNENTKPTVKVVNTAQIQTKPHHKTLTQIRELTASLPNLETKRAACLEAGHWLLTHREILAVRLGEELLSLQQNHIEEFRSCICKYLKLLGHCLENCIEPSLLYQGVITHQQTTGEIYLQAFKLIETKYIRQWESCGQISKEAAVELRHSINYLVNYFVHVFV